jgi:hypothetical protein
MGLQERVEQLFKAQEGTYHLLKPATGGSGHYNGYTVEWLQDESVRVRCTWGAIVVSEDQRQNSLLDLCLAVLVDAGLLVERVRDQTGGHLLVRDA